jgi:hypothetical protein
MTADPVAAVLALCAERLGTEYAAGVLARIGGSLGEAAREIRPGDQRARAETIAAARAVVPPWLRLVHPTWIEAALVELPARARTALATGATDPLDVWLVRTSCAALPPLATGERDVASWLHELALDQVAFALGSAAASQPALASAATRIARPPRHGALGSQRATLVRCRGVRLDDESALQRLAARALAPHLADAPLARWQLTRRLPRAQGLLVESELAVAASTPLDLVPTWAALVAT